MKKFLLLIQAALVLGGFSSCIQDEPLNAECDIIAVDSEWIGQHKDILGGFIHVGNNSVRIQINDHADRSALDPRFILTEGARLTMAAPDGGEMEGNGVMRNFTSPQTYTTHSQDGKWSKNYTVSFFFNSPIGQLSFEHFGLEERKRYEEWYEVDADDADNPIRNYWATGNSGYALTGMGKEGPHTYPTTSDPLGVSGNCIKLVTRNTGSFGSAVKMPLAAGNIFLGTFNTEMAMKIPREATQFGLQLVRRKPLRLQGYYKYKAGETVIDQYKKVHPELRDTADIYAVVYETPEKLVPLNGDEVLSSDRIVMMARIDDPGEPDDWTFFDEPFKLMPGKTFDESRLPNGYAIAIVCTSSRQGAYFEGAIGSTLYVDELRVVWEGDE